jgi:hypothetical protein
MGSIGETSCLWNQSIHVVAKLKFSGFIFRQEQRVSTISYDTGRRKLKKIYVKLYYWLNNEEVDERI